MLEPEKLLHDLLSNLNVQLPERPLTGKNILITAGPTIERIDPVRAITNLSSGKMGYSIAEAAIDMGAKVTLVSGPTHLDAPPAVKLINVETASEMLSAVMETIQNQDIFISVAAVADYRPAKTSLEKIKKSHTPLSIELIPNEDILGKVAALSNAPFCVGFAAES